MKWGGIIIYNQKRGLLGLFFVLPDKVKCGGATSLVARALRGTHTAYEVPVVPVVVIAVELGITTIVVQVVPIGSIVGRSRPPVAVRRIVERAIVVVAPGYSAE